MNTRVVCNYAVLRFRPYIESGEFINLGVVVIAQAETVCFGFKVETDRYQRVTHFFPELDADGFKQARDAFADEIRRVGCLINGNSRRYNDEVRLGIFCELVRPRESVFTFGEIGTVLATNLQATVDDLFTRYVRRQFAEAREYQETVMKRRFDEILAKHKLASFFKKNAKVGNAHFHTTFPFVSVESEVSRTPRKAMKPLDLDRDEPTKIYDHGEPWISKIKRLRDMGQAPEKILIQINYPKEGEMHMTAAKEIKRRLENLDVEVIGRDEDDKIVAFAREGVSTTNHVRQSSHFRNHVAVGT